VVIDVRADRISLRVNSRPLLEQQLPPPPSSAGRGPPSRAAALTGSVGVAVYKSRAQLKKFALSALEPTDGEGGALVPLRPPFTGGDPKLVELIEVPDADRTSPLLVPPSVCSPSLVPPSVCSPSLVPDRLLWQGEMLDASPQVSWEAIGGLEDAKRLLNEAVVLPLLVPTQWLEPDQLA
jgi:hypothetical protein